MPDDLLRAFAALSSDSERGLLLTGPELRYQAARRRSRRAGVITAAAAVLVVAATGTGWALTSDNGQKSALPAAAGVSRTAPAPSLDPSPSSVPAGEPTSASPTSRAPSSSAPPSSRPPTSEPTVVAEAIPDEIPSRVLLAQADANATVTEFKPLGVPEFCPAATFASQKQLGVSASRVSRYRKPDTPPENIPDDGVYHTVGVYRGDGARDYLAELRRAAEVCATSQIRGLGAQFGLMLPLDVGDESVLIERSYEEVDAEGKPMNNGRWRNTYIAAVRINDAVTLIDCRGYENGPSEPATARTLGQVLAKRLGAWRG